VADKPDIVGRWGRGFGRACLLFGSSDGCAAASLDACLDRPDKVCHFVSQLSQFFHRGANHTVARRVRKQ
jgi:hypothetical protein